MARTLPGKVHEVVVTPPDESGKTNKKGRSFGAGLLAWVEADGLWEGGDADTEVRRPVYAVFACDEGSAPFFRANVRLGRRVDVPDGETGNQYHRWPKTAERWEFLRSAGYKFDEQRYPGVGVALEARMVDLLRLDGAGMVAKEGAAFVMLPTRAWCGAQQAGDAAAYQHLRAIGCKTPRETIEARFPYLTATAALFAAYLDRRIRGPFPTHPLFYVQLMVGAIDAGLAGVSVEPERYGRNQQWGYCPSLRYMEYGLDRVGLLPGVAMKATHEQIEPWLAGEVVRWLDSRAAKSLR